VAGISAIRLPIMATANAFPELDSMASFRAAVPCESRAGGTIDRLCAIGHHRALARGGELRADPSDDRLVFLAHGNAKLVAQSTPLKPGGPQLRPTTGANTHILAFHFPGEIVSLLRKADGDFRLVALSDLEIVIFRANQFLDIAQAEPAILRSVLARSLQALHRSRTKMMRLGHKSAQQRIADFIVSMAERVCGCTSGQCDFSLPMSRRDIGDSLGLTIETVSRQFAELREAGLIETEGRSFIKVTDLDSLALRRGV
ncbi:MAG: helix-turn-helix domain-containing protein, partial [Pseudomonadota bacterium]